MTSSDSQRQISHLLCPSCDAEPPADLGSNLCPKCGARLVAVRAGEDALVGTVIDNRFELRARLGEGGMGTVYRAWQRSIGREVAIKLIDQRFLRDVMAVRRFLREARLASQLSQPNTVSVFDVGQSEDGRLFIAMELIRGRNLDEVMGDEGPLSAARAARIGIQLCDALEAAHQLQIIHRDLKLANVMMLTDPPGRDLVKVLDFGLAKSLADDESHKTQTGLVVGTPRYMAPELATGGSASASTDLYALGVMLGELTTGKDLWQATTFTALIGQKLSGSPVLADVPLELRMLVGKLIDPDPANRPASATATRAILLEIAGEASGERSSDRASFSDGPTITLRKPESSAPTVALATTPPPTVIRRSRAPVFAIAGVALLAIAAVVFVATRAGEQHATTPPPADAAPHHTAAAAATPPPPPLPAPPDAAPAAIDLHVGPVDVKTPPVKPKPKHGPKPGAMPF